MPLKFDRYPVTLIFCIIWSVIAIFFVLFDINNLLRIILSIPIIIFIPGYLLFYALFPEKSEKVFDVVERIALGVGISIGIVPFFGIFLYIFTRFQKPEQALLPIIFTLEAFIFIVGTIAIIRWFHTPPENRYIPKINISIPKHETKFDKLLTTLLILCVIITVSLVIYVGLTPKQEEHFTEFYILGSNQVAYNYSINLTTLQNATVTLGIVNHENRNMNYSIEVWLSNQTIKFNASTTNNENVYHNFWFIEKIKDPKTNHTYFNLAPQPLNLEENFTNQTEFQYSIQINQSQLNLTQNKNWSYKLIFLLYTKQTQPYAPNMDYYIGDKNIVAEKADNALMSAYRSLYLWIY